MVSDEALTAAWSAVTGLLVASPGEFSALNPLPDVLIPAFLRNARCVPIRAVEGALIPAVEDPIDDFSPTAIAVRTGLRIERRIGRSGDLDLWLKSLPNDDAAAPAAKHEGDDALALDIERLRDRACGTWVVRLVNAIIDHAIESRASTKYARRIFATNNQATIGGGVVAHRNIPLVMVAVENIRAAARGGGSGLPDARTPC